MISSQFIQQISVKTEKQSFLKDRDLIFQSFYSEVYSYIVDANMFFVYIQNNELINMIIQQYVHLDSIIDYKKEDCYTVSIENINIAVYMLLIKLVI